MNALQMKQLKAGAILYNARHLHFTVLIQVSGVTADGLDVFPYSEDAKYLHDADEVLPWSEAAFLSEVDEDRIGEPGYLI